MYSLQADYIENTDKMNIQLLSGHSSSLLPCILDILYIFILFYVLVLLNSQ